MRHNARTGGLGPAISAALVLVTTAIATIPVHALRAQDSTKTKSWGVVYSSPRSRQQSQGTAAPASATTTATPPAVAPTTLPQTVAPAPPAAQPVPQPPAPAQTTVLPSITGSRTYSSYNGDVAPAQAPTAPPQVTYAVPAPTYQAAAPTYPAAPAYVAPAPPAAPPVYAGDPAPAVTASAPATYPAPAPAYQAPAPAYQPPPTYPAPAPAPAPQYGSVSTLTVDTNPPAPAAGPAAAGSSTIRLDEMMSLHEWDASGAARLKPQELAVLERWIERYRAALLDSATRLASGQSAAPRIVAPNPGGTVHAKDAHQVAAIKAGSRYITLDDNSVWDIYSSDQTETASWQPGDWVQVRLASIAYGDYDHELVNNQRTGPVRAKFMGYAKPDVTR
jgi:hypothetical protein